VQCLDVNFYERGAHVVVTLRGDLDVVNAASVAVEIGVFAAAGRVVIVDLAELEFLDCDALGTLLGVRERAQAAGGDVLLAAPHGSPLRVLALISSATNFRFHASVGAAAVAAGVDSELRELADQLAEPL
jgi:anti-sigma B factor antagonist